MTALVARLGSETIKINRTATLLLTSLVGLVALAIGLHAFGLSVGSLSRADQQRGILIDVGINLGSAFAALLGALVITAEVRNGTIRPTLLATPRRMRLFATKAAVALVLGALTGLLSVGTSALVAVVGLDIRGVAVHLTAATIAHALVGGLAGGALWALIGLSVGTVIRGQVPTIVGLLAWILFVENVLMDLPKIHRFVPGALAQSLAGQTRDGVLSSGWLAGGLLVVYALVAIVVAVSRFQRQDVA